MEVLALNLSSAGLEFATVGRTSHRHLRGIAQLSGFDFSEAQEAAQRLFDAMEGQWIHVASSGGVDLPVGGGVYRIPSGAEGALGAAGPLGFAPLVALLLSQMLGGASSALLVEPMTSNEILPSAGITGLPELPVRPLRHSPQVKWANIRAREEGLFHPDASSVVAYLGRSFSVCALRGDRILDSNNPEETGPFSVAFAGSLPAMDLVREAMRGVRTREELTRLVAGGGGVAGYLNTYLMTEVEAAFHRGQPKAQEVVRAMAHQVSQAIGAMAGTLNGEVDFIALCGGCAAFGAMVDLISSRVQWIAPVLLYPDVTGLVSVGELALRSLEGRYLPPQDLTF